MDIQQAFAELGLNPHATPAQARLCYQMLALRWHPHTEANPEAMARMQAIETAYETVVAHLLVRADLSPVAKRTALPVLELGDAIGPPSGFAEFDCKAGFAGARRVQPFTRVLRISLAEAAQGCIKRVSASANGSSLRCGGETDASTIWVADVRIRPGTLDGAEVAPEDIHLCASSPSQPSGLRLPVLIEKHPLFCLEQDRLTVTVPISIWDWLLGGELTVPTLQGHVHMQLPPRAGVMKLPDRGWPRADQPGQYFPLYVQLRRIYPHRLDDGDLQLVKGLAQRARLPEVAGWQRSLQAWMETTP